MPVRLVDKDKEMNGNEDAYCRSRHTGYIMISSCHSPIWIFADEIGDGYFILVHCIGAVQ
jgi:hypothetical protein